MNEYLNNDNIAIMLRKIEENKKLIEDRGPFHSVTLKSLEEYYRVDLTYTSNALEGNTLDRTETKIVIEDGITVAGKPLRDIYEAVGHAAAFDFMMSNVKNNETITEELILELHRKFYEKIDQKRAGQYREVPVIISGTDYTPPAAEKVPELMNNFIHWSAENEHLLHPVIWAAYHHKFLVDIHPFIDGNGRTARLLLNLCLLKKGLNIILIPPVMRREYIAAVDRSHGDDTDFIDMICELELEGQKDYKKKLRIGKSRG